MTNLEAIRGFSVDEMLRVLLDAQSGEMPWCDDSCWLDGKHECGLCVKKWLNEEKEQALKERERVG